MAETAKAVETVAAQVAAKPVVAVKHPFKDLVVGQKYAYSRPYFNLDEKLKGKKFFAVIEEAAMIDRSRKIVKEKFVTILPEGEQKVEGVTRSFMLKELPHDAVFTAV